MSYVRARAEVEGVQIYDGLFSRAVRIIFLSAGLMLGELHIILWVLAIMTLLTTFHRLFVVWLKLRGDPETEPPRS